jgi:hypothetical protein
MRYRRSEFDVTDRINTTDPVCDRLEVERLHRALYPGAPMGPLDRVFEDIPAYYRGEHPAFEKCDTAYHDLQHIMEVSLAMARLMDGYERGHGEAPGLGEKLFQLGVICALYHDSGYIRRTGDKKHRNGAEYTVIHVSRGAQFLRKYLPTIGLGEFADIAGQIVHFTGYERPVATIRVPDPIYKLLGSLLGSADIIAQMSDRCYLEKCRDRLYPEFVAGGIARKKTGNGEVIVFASAEDLVRKTPAFYQTASRRLDVDLGGTYRYAKQHFGGNNLYLDAVKQNVRFAERFSGMENMDLRRMPPINIA